MPDLDRWIREATGAASLGRMRRLESLWGGYGEIVRVPLRGASADSAVLKRVDVPGHERGRSHARKLRSYRVEHAWYRRYADRCGAGCRVPRALALDEAPGRWWFLLEDLDAAGFPGRRHAPVGRELDACLAWLASFHATFLGAAPDGLWSEGTYWHLATRPDELALLDDGPLKEAAGALDARLRGARHRTFVHGDSKPANFCFGGHGVAAVDFQYVGGGCGVRDVAYLLHGAHSDDAVDRYFAALRRALAGRDVDADALEAEWRALYPVAWADFERFLAGWAPGQEGRDRASKRLLAEALATL